MIAKERWKHQKKGGVRKKRRIHTELRKLWLCTLVNNIVTPVAWSQGKFLACRAVRPLSALTGPEGIMTVIMPDLWKWRHTRRVIQWIEAQLGNKLRASKDSEDGGVL